MNTPQNEPLEFSGFNERLTAGVHAHQRKLRALTAASVIFGLLSLLASIAIVWAYFILYLPKQKQLLADLGAVPGIARAQPRGTNPAEGTDLAHQPLRLAEIQGTMMHAVSFGTMLVGIAAGLSAMGTLVLLALLMTSRRATLNQINASLAQISAQLRVLSEKAAVGPSS